MGYILEQKQAVAELIKLHNQSTKQFLHKCQGTCVWGENAVEVYAGVEKDKQAPLVAKLLRYQKDANVEKVIDTVGGSSEFQKEILKSFCDTFSFKGEPIDEAMRIFVSAARLIGESQVLERCLKSFAHRYFLDAGNKFGLKNESVAVTFAYSIMILHTDVYHKTLKTHMSLTDFLKNNTKINEGDNFSDELITSIYESIKNKEFSTPSRSLFLPDYNEWMWKDLNQRTYTEAKITGEIDSSVLLDLNDITKPQINQRSGHFISCAGLNPVLLRYVIRQALQSFFHLLDKCQFKTGTWRALAQPEFVAVILNTMETFADLAAGNSMGEDLDRLVESLWEIAGMDGRLSEWAANKNGMQVGDKLCAILKRHHQGLGRGFCVMAKMMIFQMSAVRPGCYNVATLRQAVPGGLRGHIKGDARARLPH